MLAQADIHVNKKDLNHLTDVYGLLDDQAEAAAYRAIRKTANWMKVIASREISKEMKLAQKVVRQRLKVFMQDRQALQAKIWLGLYSIRASQLANTMSQTRTGTTVGRHRFPGAFVATMKTGHRDVYKRRGQARLPIDIQQLDISDKARKVLLDVSRRTDRRLMEVLHQELNYELQKVVSNAH